MVWVYFDNLAGLRLFDYGFGCVFYGLVVCFVICGLLFGGLLVMFIVRSLLADLGGFVLWFLLRFGF